MMVVIKRDRRRLWSSDYCYKGGWEFSGFSVNTADEAARHTAKQMGAEMRDAFGNRE